MRWRGTCCSSLGGPLRRPCPATWVEDRFSDGPSTSERPKRRWPRLAIFERLGSPDWAERARSELGRVGLCTSSRWELTTTERQVAELAGAGHTYREVAQLLFMSPKTVEANLSRVYRKLEIHSRAELGARMAERQEATSAEA